MNNLVQPVWPERAIESVDQVHSWLAEHKGRDGFVFRGQGDSSWHLQPSLDRNVAPASYDERLREEQDLIDNFTNGAARFLGALERTIISRLPAYDRVGRMTVMQHFGAPTRLLDWTYSPAVAAYFACIDEDGKHGSIWWFNVGRLAPELDRRWAKYGLTRHQNREIDYNERVFRPDVPEFVGPVGPVGLIIPFPRAQAQRALFTLGSRLGCLHDKVLATLLPEGEYGRVTIPPSLKADVIQHLNSLGIDAVSLQHAGADRCGLRISWERMQRAGTK